MELTIQRLFANSSKTSRLGQSDSAECFWKLQGQIPQMVFSVKIDKF